MSGRAQWLASRQAIPSSPAKPVVAPMTRRPVRGWDACRVHGTQLLDVDSHGGRYRKSICLECLPPHRPSCIQGEYVEKQTIFYALELAMNPDYDLADVEFWERFDQVPDCRCPERRRAMELREEAPMAEPAPAFHLSIGREASAYHWRTLRPRLARLARQQIGNRVVLNWELERLAELLDVIPAESARARARAILELLREFEVDSRALTSPGSNRSGAYIREN